MAAVRSLFGRSGAPGGLDPLSPRRKWRAITIATLILVPAFWSILAGAVSGAVEGEDAVEPAAAVAFGLAIIPFVFVALAFGSQHPRAPSAVVKAMGLCVLVGPVVAALAGDVVTGLVAGVGAGGVVALRRDAAHDLRHRALATVIASFYVFVLVRAVGAIVLVPAPALAFTAIGVADHVSEWRLARAS